MKLFILTLCIFGSVTTSAAECGHWLTGKLLAHVANRRGSRHHNLVTALAAPDPIDASNGLLLRWNVIANVPGDKGGWAAEGFRSFIAKTDARVEVIPSADPHTAIRAIRAIMMSDEIEYEKIWVLVDFTDAPLGSWLAPEFEAMWIELNRRRDEFIPDDSEAPAALILPIVLIPDDLETLPRREDPHFQFKRPNVQQIFGFHDYEKFLK